MQLRKNLLDKDASLWRRSWNVKPANVLPTLPSFSAVRNAGVERTALLAGLTFIEGATTWRLPELLGWYTSYGGVLGMKTLPDTVSDAVVGTITLARSSERRTPPGDRRMLGSHPDLDGPRSRPRGRAGIDELPKLLAMTRWRVIITMRGLLSSPCDDRFLQSAIFAGRVRRHRSEWIAEPRETDVLSDVVLSLFAVDVLSYREFHEQNLCICDVCGRISYNPAVSTRSGCSDHLPRIEAESGFQSSGYDD